MAEIKSEEELKLLEKILATKMISKKERENACCRGREKRKAS
jgi:hypothetical protein